jgi:hypothetical protein
VEANRSRLPDGRFGRQRGCTGLQYSHCLRVAQLVTDHGPASAVGIEAARLKGLDPEGALRGDDQLETGDLGVLDDRWLERLFQRRLARGLGDLRLGDGRPLRVSSDRLAGRSVHAPYMHFDANVNQNNTVLFTRCTTMRHDVRR